MSIRLPHRPLMSPLLTAAAIFILPGCIHLTHPSNVRPGWSAEIVGGASREKYREGSMCGNCRGDEPSTGDVTVAQLNLAWGRRLGTAGALRTALMVPLSMNNGSALGAMGGTTLDIYYQFLKGPIGMGAGGMTGLVISGVYMQAGKTFRLSEKCEMDIDLGASAEIALFREPAIRPFFLAGIVIERWRAGLWADYLKYGDFLKRCDENCEADDYIERSVSGGFFLDRRF